jgi:transglycosylase-like protein
VQGRLTEVEADLAIAQVRLARTQERLQSERARLERLKVRLSDGRELLAEQLVAQYKSDPPDVVGLVVGAHDFADLIERFETAKRVQERNGEIVDRVHAARDETHQQAVSLAKLEDERRDTAEAVASRRDALAGMRVSLGQRQSTLTRVRAARAQALAGTRAGRASAEKALNALIAERERAQREAAGGGGPGGPWAIPWPIVQCESGGQNLPPNSAGASGYYQMLPDTWKGLGGSTPHAYQASKAEQDRLAAQLWAGGAGARNWVCAGLV